MRISHSKDGATVEMEYSIIFAELEKPENEEIMRLSDEIDEIHENVRLINQAVELLEDLPVHAYFSE